MKKTSSDMVSISDGQFVKVKRMNHVVEVRHSSKMNNKPNIKKIDADRYIEISTGEIKEFTHSENRSQNYSSLRQTFNRLRDLINMNFVGRANELHVTLTYGKHVTDPKELYLDFDKFIKRLRYSYKEKSTIDYLSVVEPQGSGRWHCHVLMRFNELESIYIPNVFDKQTKTPINAPMYDLWGNGWVTIHSLKDVDNIGAYLSAYLTDVELSNDTFVKAIEEKREVVVKVVDGEEKKFIKGGRMHMYPSGMNLYRKSKGIVPPIVEEMSFGKVKKIVGAATPHYQKSITVQDDDYEITHQYLQYNTKRLIISSDLEDK